MPSPLPPKTLLQALSAASAVSVLISLLACGAASEQDPEPDPLPARSRGVRCGDGPGNNTCYPSERCEAHTDGEQYCFCPVGTVPGSGSKCVDEGSSPTTNAPICSQLEDDACQGQGLCYDLDDDACDYLVDHQVSELPECAYARERKRAIGVCVSSLQAPAQALYGEDSQCAFTQFWSNPTALPVDCRCTHPSEVIQCKRPYSLPPTAKLGQGQRFRDLDQVDQLGGFQDKREMIVATSWKSSRYPKQGLIIATNLDNGVRRVVSGAYVDPSDGYKTVGQGPAFGLVTHALKGADGAYYVASVDEVSEGAGKPIIFKVSPTTGDREIVYNANAPDQYGVCPNGADPDTPGTKVVQLRGGNAWTMDTQGNHYFAPFGASPGPAIVKVDKTGKTCTYVTRVPDGPTTFDPPVLGEGFDNIQFDFEGLHIHDGKLYALSDKYLIEVNLADGRRKLISDAKAGSVGAGPYGASESLGRAWTGWDPHHQVIWTWGSPGDDNILIAVDPQSGDRISAPCWHPTLGRQAACQGNGAQLGGYMGQGAMIVDEQAPHDLFLAFDNEAIVRIEQQTGNINIISR